MQREGLIARQGRVGVGLLRCMSFSGGATQPTAWLGSPLCKTCLSHKWQ